MARVIRRLSERVRAEATSDGAKRLLTATFVLTGLRLPRNVALELFRGIEAMQESTTYQYILEQGAVAEARKFVLLIGQDQLGPADERVKAALEGIDDVRQLEELGRRVLRAGSWQELLPESKQPKGRRRKKTEP